MDGKHHYPRVDAAATNAERMRPHADRRINNPFLFRDSSVDPVNTAEAEKVNRFMSPKYMTMEQQSLLMSDQMTPQESEMRFLEQSERMEKKLQQSMMLLNHKQQMQQKILLMQQQQIQQQRQVQLQYQNEHVQQPQPTVQQRMLRQRSPEKQRQDSSIDNQTAHQKLEHHHAEETPKAQCPESVDNISVQDLFTQCQGHLDVINACTDLQQTIKDEMKKQAKLDNIICQKLVSKAQRLQQQASFLEKARAPSWVGPALLDLGSQVTQQAEVHHIYTATLIEQCVVIQHSLDGHHELMKSVLAEHGELKQKSAPLGEMRIKGNNYAADKRGQLKAGDEPRSMTFHQASNIFEGIRKPRMRLLSSLEYQQDQLTATVTHLGQVDTEIDAISNKEDSEGLMWRTQLQKKDLAIRKEFLEARKEQLESDVQFARMDLNEFELTNKETLLEVLNVFCQHRIRYDTTLRHSFQLLQAATLRDTNYLRRLTKKADLDSTTDLDSGDMYEGLTSKVNDPWSCTSEFASKMVSVALPSNNEQASVMFLKSTSPQISTKKSPYLARNPQEQTEAKIPGIDQTYPIVLSSDSEMSEVQKSSMYSPELKPVKMPTVNSYNVGQFQNLSDFNFSRAESPHSLTETNDGSASLVDVSDLADTTKPSSNWSIVNEKLKSFMENTLTPTKDDGKLIISRYVGDGNVCENQPLKSSFHSGTEDMMVVTRGPKSRQTLGNFENSVESECSIHCLYPMTSVREPVHNREEKRTTHLINKYASGGRGSRFSLGKNWNSCKPMLWSGIGKSLVRDKDSRRKMNKSLKYCKLVTQHNVLAQYNENKHTVVMEPGMAHFKGQNMNNSEILHGQDDHESDICIKPSPEQYASLESIHGCSPGVDDGKSQVSSGSSLDHHRQDKVGSSESAAEVNQEGSAKQTGSVREDFNDDRTDNQCVSRVMDNCESLPGQESRNLNNCEPLKCQVVNAEIVTEREDQMDFEAVQVLFPDSQPRQVRVCAVRPISSEVDRVGTGQTVAKGLTNDDSEISQPRRALSYKYDNLKVYEITAGQFTVSELETDSKYISTAVGNRVDCSNNKSPDFSKLSSKVFSDQDSLKKSGFVACKNRDCERRTYDTVKTKTIRKSSFLNCDCLPSAKTADGSCKNANCKSVACHADFCTDQFSIGEESVESRSSDTKNIKDPSFAEFLKSEKVSSCLNYIPNKDKLADKFDEEETLTKTLYQPEETLTKTLYQPEENENNVKLCGSGDNLKPADDVTGSISEQNTLHGCNYDKLNDNREVTNANRQLTPNVSKQMTGDATDQATRTISGQRMDTTEDGQTGKITELLLENRLPCRYENHSESKGEMTTARVSDTSTSHTSDNIWNEMSNFSSKQANSQTNLFDESNANESHSLKQLNDNYFKTFANKESVSETKECKNSQQEMQTRPLKSNLKKHCSNYAGGLDSCSGGGKWFPQCGMPSLAGTKSNQVSMQGDSDIAHKCVKQVRFNHIVHYDDNTVTETLDVTVTSQETPTNSTDCSELISGRPSQTFMYSTNMASSSLYSMSNLYGIDAINYDFSSNTSSI